MAVTRANLIQPLPQPRLPVNKQALVVGGGLAGMTAALNLAEQGFETHLVERSAELGGNARQLTATWQGDSIPAWVEALRKRCRDIPRSRFTSKLP